jgi:hypothetical protein
MDPRLGAVADDARTNERRRCYKRRGSAQACWVPLPFLAVGPSLTVVGWARTWQQSRRKVKLTVHRAYKVEVLFAVGDGPLVEVESENYYITVTNASRNRDIEVTHVWLDTTPKPVHVFDPDLPVRLKYSAQWATAVPVSSLPDGTTNVAWLARCQVSPDGKVIKSRPSKNVAPVGTVPRG